MQKVLKESESKIKVVQLIQAEDRYWVKLVQKKDMEEIFRYNYGSDLPLAEKGFVILNKMIVTENGNSSGEHKAEDILKSLEMLRNKLN